MDLPAGSLDVPSNAYHEVQRSYVAQYETSDDRDDTDQGEVEPPPVVQVMEPSEMEPVAPYALPSIVSIHHISQTDR